MVGAKFTGVFREWPVSGKGVCLTTKTALHYSTTTAVDDATDGRLSAHQGIKPLRLRE